MKKFAKAVQIALSAALAAGIFVFGCGFSPAKMPRGCFIDGADVSGMTVPAVQSLIGGRLQRALDGYSLTVRAGGRAYTFAPPSLYVKSDLSAVLRRARRQGGAYALHTEICLRREEETLRGICDDLYRKSVSARFEFRPSREQPFLYEAEKNGRVLDGAELKERVRHALRAGEREITLSPRTQVPSYTLEKAKEETCLLAAFTTRYDAGNAPRAHNIALAAEKIGGCVLEAGQVFSFNAAAGARTAENGYREAPVILDGEFVSGVGGGVCQVSTTVYNAALLAGLRVAEYHPHSLAVGYVEPSFDAMVSGESCDLKLCNDSGGRVYFVCRAVHGALTVQIYGVRSDTAYIRESVVTGRVPPPEPEIREGAEDAVIRAAKDGIRSEGYLIVRRAGMPDRRVRLRRDSYACVQGILQRAPQAEGAREERGENRKSGDLLQNPCENVSDVIQ